MSIVEVLFVSALSVVFYTYIGYGIVLWILVKQKYLRQPLAQ